MEATLENFGGGIQETRILLALKVKSSMASRRGKKTPSFSMFLVCREGGGTTLRN